MCRPPSEYFLFVSFIVVFSLSLSFSDWCERITHCSKENTFGTFSNICLHFSDLPLSAVGLFFLHVSHSYSFFISLTIILQVVHKLSVCFHSPSNWSFQSCCFSIIKQVERSDSFPDNSQNFYPLTSSWAIIGNLVNMCLFMSYDHIPWGGAALEWVSALELWARALFGIKSSTSNVGSGFCNECAPCHFLCLPYSCTGYQNAA